LPWVRGILKGKIHGSLPSFSSLSKNEGCFHLQSDAAPATDGLLGNG
jgi:hypothetical protein